jgi:predicted GIY-YIG superfamily endonuclease
MHLEPIVVFPVVYILRLEDDCYYVGITMNLNQRLAQHWTESGAKWTKLHKPIEVLRVVYRGDEQDITNDMIALYGREKVRGGNHTRC